MRLKESHKFLPILPAIAMILSLVSMLDKLSGIKALYPSVIPSFLSAEAGKLRNRWPE
jgi:hypothetical protein